MSNAEITRSVVAAVVGGLTLLTGFGIESASANTRPIVGLSGDYGGWSREEPVGADSGGSFESISPSDSIQGPFWHVDNQGPFWLVDNQGPFWRKSAS